MTNQNDAVNHPKHYTSHPSGIECIQVIASMPFPVGSLIKYCWRSYLKGKHKEDLQKAAFYLRYTAWICDQYKAESELGANFVGEPPRSYILSWPVLSPKEVKDIIDPYPIEIASTMQEVMELPLCPANDRFYVLSVALEQLQSYIDKLEE